MDQNWLLRGECQFPRTAVHYAVNSCPQIFFFYLCVCKCVGLCSFFTAVHSTSIDVRCFAPDSNASVSPFCFSRSSLLRYNQAPGPDGEEGEQWKRFAFFFLRSGLQCCWWGGGGWGWGWERKGRGLCGVQREEQMRNASPTLQRIFLSNAEGRCPGRRQPPHL